MAPEGQDMATPRAMSKLTRIVEVCVGPGADDSGCPMSLATGGKQVIGALKRDEAARVARQAENLARVLDADRGVGGRMQDQQRQAQAFDLGVQVSHANILDE